LNEEKNIVIIGCGASGGTAAQFARKTNRKSKITIFEKSKYPQYSKCALPYVLSDTIKNVEDLIEFSEEWFNKNKIDIHLNTIVEKIDAEKHIVYANKDGKEIKKSYDSLIVSTGAKPSTPHIENIDTSGVFNVRTIEDIKSIYSWIKKCKKATILGAGFIGLEVADNLFKKGMKITIVECLPYILPTIFDEDMSKYMFEKIAKNISVLTNHVAIKIERENGKIDKVVIKDVISGEKKSIDTDILVNATGIKPNVNLAKNAGCKIGQTGGIIVNNKCETNIKNIYAIGDCTEYKDFVTKKPILIGLGSIAVRQGIAAGINASGGKYDLHDGFLQTFASEFFDLEVAGVGPSKDSFNIPVISGKYSGSSLPDYYPGGKPITIKISVNKKNGNILRAQAIGDKAAQRINTFACAILAGMNIEKFRKLETAYAPPISPTLDAETLVCDIVALKLNRKR
jgi:NADH oxidase (H2O2-forming)